MKLDGAHGIMEDIAGRIDSFFEVRACKEQETCKPELRMRIQPQSTLLFQINAFILIRIRNQGSWFLFNYTTA